MNESDAEEDERAIYLINKFVRNHTEGVLSNFLTERLPKDTVMVLVNAFNVFATWISNMTEEESPMRFNSIEW